MPSNYDAGFSAGQAAAVKAIQKLIDRSASVEDERDEWKRLHEELVEVRRADLAAVAAAHAREIAALAIQPAQGVQAAGDAKPFAWAYVPSPTWKEVVITMDEKRADEARGFGCDVSPLYLAAPTVADRVPLTPAQREILDFLYGSGNVRGVGYGTQPEGERAPFWWRRELAAAFPEITARHGIGAEKTGAQG